ncbi:BrnT family toxin [Leptolyngbyaceae cyanobacterium UHCC 1019]
MRFEWGDNKAESNARRHGITFKEAVTVFADPYLVFTEDSRHSQEEEREWAIERRKMVQLLSLFLR